MAYIVVTFDDQTISEVPYNWLESKSDELSLCWWPTNFKNISSLIMKRAEPDEKTWQLLSVTIEKWYRTYLYFIK